MKTQACLILSLCLTTQVASASKAEELASAGCAWSPRKQDCISVNCNGVCYSLLSADVVSDAMLAKFDHINPADGKVGFPCSEHHAAEIARMANTVPTCFCQKN